MVRASLLATSVWALSLICAGSALAASETAPWHVSIVTPDGRTLEGVVDTRTDEHRLWLRQTGDNIVLTSSVAWMDVASATLNGESLNSRTLRRRRESLATVEPKIPHGASATASATTTTPAPDSPASSRSGWRMRNVEIVETCLVNLDRDVEPDGLQVVIAAIGDDGRSIPVGGSLTAELMVERRPALVAQVDFGPLDRWNQPVRAEEFVDGAATYIFPFRHAAPQWQFDVLPDAILTVRLGAFGQGNFAASAPVIIRPLNPLRDDRQLLDETRFMPGERRGRNPHNRLRSDNGLWLHWTR